MSSDLAALLQHLADEARSVRSINLAALSDVRRGDIPQFRVAWTGFSPARRVELIADMVEQAEANIHLNFHAVLRICLEDADPRVRKLAVEGLWEDEKTNLILPLTDILSGDPSPDVRAAAAMSLGRFVLLGILGEIADEHFGTVERRLRDAWRRKDETDEVRRRVLESLAYTDAEDVADLIEGAYYHGDALMRQSAVFAMGRTGNPRWSKQVLAELGSREPAMRFEAAVAAGEMGLKSSVQTLIHRLEDADGSVREAAATALGKIGGPVARRALERLVAGEDESLAQAAEEALEEWEFSSNRLGHVLMDLGDEAASGGDQERARDGDDAGFDDDDELADDEDDGFSGLFDDEQALDQMEDDWDLEDDGNELDWEEEEEDSDDQGWR